MFSWIDDETGELMDSYWVKGTYGKAITGSLVKSGDNATMWEDGHGQDDVGPELKALIELVRNTDGRGVAHT